MNLKSLFTSKTFWLAVLQGAVGAGVAAVHPDPTVQAIGGGAVLKSLVDVGLRLVTNQGVSVSGAQ
jgi:hypothetical protein